MNRGDDPFVLDGCFVLNGGANMPDRTAMARFLIPPLMPTAEFCGPALGSGPRRHRSRLAPSRRRVVHFSHGGGLYVGWGRSYRRASQLLVGELRIPHKLAGSRLCDHGYA